MGFSACPVAPAVYRNHTTGVRLVVHADDLLMGGRPDELRKLVQQLAKFVDLKHTLLKRPGVKGCEDGDKEGEFLKRRVRWVADGLEYSGDGSGKLVETILREWECEECKEATTPGVKGHDDPHSPVVIKGVYTKYRRTAAQLNYVSLDRADLSFAAKEVCRGVSNPTHGDVMDLKRIVRYLKGVPSLVYKFFDTGGEGEIHGYTDSDWGSCPRSFRSTSGGCVSVGRNLVHFHSRTQTTVSLSSGEAELVASVNLIMETLLVRSLLAFWRDKTGVVHLYGDSSAAKGVMMRQGAGRIKHLTLKHLWNQDYVQSGVAVPHKIPRERNPADLFTHYWTTGEWKILGGYLNVYNGLISWPRGGVESRMSVAKDKKRKRLCSGFVWYAGIV